MTAISMHNSGVHLPAVLATAGRLVRPLVELMSRIKLAVVPLRAEGPQPRVDTPVLAVALQKSVEPVRLSAAAQWARVTDVVSTAIAGAKSAVELQSSATQQLDLAQYGLSTLMDELSAVMAVPGRRERAQVFRLEPVTAQPASHALAA